MTTGEAAKPPPEAPTPVSTPAVHPLAFVAPDAQLGAGVAVGPFALVEPGVSLGAGTLLHAHAVVRAGTRLGAGNVVHPFAVLGGDPQERTYAGEATTLEIGDRNTFREHVTVHRGSAKGSGVTRIGERQPAHGRRPRRRTTARWATGSSWRTACSWPGT